MKHDDLTNKGAVCPFDGIGNFRLSPSHTLPSVFHQLTG